ncbi:MAG: Nif11-like leader peptide family natural product precursor [Clostridiales bacterium]|nr:Nif11-like leader peptide family natural product precursor [Clostridiales bacterium]
MSENLKAFLAKVSADALLIERLKAAKEYGEIIALAKEIGVELTLADIEPENSELSEDELNAVSGGKSGGCFCVLAGSGGGKNGRDDVYGCACVAYGQGGDGSKDDFTCFCALGGEGVIDVMPDELV